MDRSQLFAAFARDKVDPGALSSEPQTELALRFTVYQGRGLIRDGLAPPLWDCCPHAAACWRAAWDARPAGGPEDGGISLPWIGPEYRPGGVVVLGINFNDANGLTRAYEIAPEDADEMAAGRRRVNYGIHEYRGSDFPYRSTRSAALLVDFLAGIPVTDREDPEAVARYVYQILRLQAIKCSPRSDDASKPTNEMWANCPPLLLEDELRIAEPGAIVGFGADVPLGTRTARRLPSQARPRRGAARRASTRRPYDSRLSHGSPALHPVARSARRARRTAPRAAAAIRPRRRWRVAQAASFVPPRLEALGSHLVEPTRASGSRRKRKRTGDRVDARVSSSPSVSGPDRGAFLHARGGASSAVSGSPVRVESVKVFLQRGQA